MTNKELVRNFLQQEGYKFDENKELIHFKANGLNLVCETSSIDNMFIRILAPVIYSLSDHSDVSRAKVLTLCNNLVESTKILKAFLDNDGDVTLSVELFVSEDVSDLTSVLNRALNILGQGRFEFALKIND